MKVPASKKRNPFGLGENMPKAGSHSKTNKQKRKAQNKDEQKLNKQ